MPAEVSSPPAVTRAIAPRRWLSRERIIGDGSLCRHTGTLVIVRTGRAPGLVHEPGYRVFEVTHESDWSRCDVYWSRTQLGSQRAGPEAPGRWAGGSETSQGSPPN